VEQNDNNKVAGEGANVGFYKARVKSILTDNYGNYKLLAGSSLVVNSKTMEIYQQTITKDNVFATANHYAVEYSDAGASIDENNFTYTIVVTDKDTSETYTAKVEVDANASNFQIGIDTAWASSQKDIGIYNIKATISLTGSGNYKLEGTVVKEFMLNKTSTAKTEFAIVPIATTMVSVHKVYDGTTLLDPNIPVTMADNFPATDKVLGQFGSPNVNVDGDKSVPFIFDTQTFSYYPTGATTRTTVYRIKVGESASLSNYYISDGTTSTPTITGHAWILPQQVEIVFEAEKEYDGTTEFLGGIKVKKLNSEETIDVKVSGGFEDRNAGDNKKYTIETKEWKSPIGNETYYLLDNKNQQNSSANNYCIDKDKASNTNGKITKRVVKANELDKLELLKKIDATDFYNLLNADDKVIYAADRTYTVTNLRGHISLARPDNAPAVTTDFVSGNLGIKLLHQDDTLTTYTIELNPADAHNAGNYTITITIGGDNYEGTITKTLTIHQQVVERTNFKVYMPNFEGVYGTGNYRKPSPTGEGLEVRIVDSLADGNPAVTFDGGQYRIESYLFGEDKATEIAGTKGLFIGGYRVWASKVVGTSNDNNYVNNYVINGELTNIEIFLPDTQTPTQYFITPADLNGALVSVEKTYDSTTATTNATFNMSSTSYEVGNFDATYASARSTHSGDGKTALNYEGINKAVNFTVQAHNLNGKDYFVATGGGALTNYHITTATDTTGTLENKAIIKKYVITTGDFVYSATGVVDTDNSQASQTLAEQTIENVTKDSTVNFVYSNAYKYGIDNFTITGITGFNLFEGDKVTDFAFDALVATPTDINEPGKIVQNVGTYEITIKSIQADNYEVNDGRKVCTLNIVKQLVNPDDVQVNVPFINKVYDGQNVAPAESNNFSFVIKDKYSGEDATANQQNTIVYTYYDETEGDLGVNFPINIGGYKVKVTVTIAADISKNYEFGGNDAGGTIVRLANGGEDVYFILPKELTVTKVHKEYDATQPINANTTIEIDEQGFVAGDNFDTVKGALQGKFASKDIVEEGGDVVFTGLDSMQYKDSDGKTMTAYYLANTNYTIAGAKGSNVTVVGVGRITPARITINSMTKMYDGNDRMVYVADKDTNKTIENVTIPEALRPYDKFVRPAGRYDSANGYGVTEPNKIDVWLEYTIYKDKDNNVEYYKLVNSESAPQSNAKNYYVWKTGESTPTTVTKDGKNYVVFGQKGIITKVDISGGTGTSIDDIKINEFKWIVNGQDRYFNTTIIYSQIVNYNIQNFGATLQLMDGQNPKAMTYDAEKNKIKAEAIGGDILYFDILIKKGENPVEGNTARVYGTYKVSLILDTALTNANALNNYNYKSVEYSFSINKQALGSTNITSIVVEQATSIYNGNSELGVGSFSGKTVTITVKDNDGLAPNEKYNDGKFDTSKLKISAVKEMSAINAGTYSPQVWISGLDADNYSLATGSDVFVTAKDAYKVNPYEIDLSQPQSVTKDFDGTINFVRDGVNGEKVVIGSTSVNPINALAGTSQLAFEGKVMNVIVGNEPNTYAHLRDGENTPINQTIACGNYVIKGADGKINLTLTINPTNNLVAERIYTDKAVGGGKENLIEVAVSGLAGLDFANIDNTATTETLNADNTASDNIAKVMKAAINGFDSMLALTADNIYNVRVITTTDALGYSTYTLVFRYKPLSSDNMDTDTYTDRYVLAVAGNGGGLSTNKAVTSSELADGQIVDNNIVNAGTAVATKEDLVKALEKNENIHLTANIYDFDASVFKTAVNYTGTLHGNGYVIQLVGGLNVDGNVGGAFVASLGGTIQDVNFKFTSSQVLNATATTVGLIAGKSNGATFLNTSLDIISTPGTTANVGGYVGEATGGSFTHATVVFNAVMTGTSAGFVHTATSATFTNVTAKSYVRLTAGETLATNSLAVSTTNTTFGGVIDMVGIAMVDNDQTMTNVYTINPNVTGANANHKLELLDPYKDGFIEYFFTKHIKSGDSTHNKVENLSNNNEKNKTIYNSYGTIGAGSILAIETLAPKGRFVWEAYNHIVLPNTNKTQTSIAINRYVVFMPIGTTLQEKSYTLARDTAQTIEFVTGGTNMFVVAIGIHGETAISTDAATIKEVEYTGAPITHTVKVTVGSEEHTAQVTGTEVGYYDMIIKEVQGDIATDNIVFDTGSRTIVVGIQGGTTQAGAILIIRPKQEAISSTLSKAYDTTAIGQVNTSVGGNVVTLVGTMGKYENNVFTQDGTVKGVNAISFANTLDNVRRVLAKKNADGTYTYQKQRYNDKENKYVYSNIQIKTTKAGGGYENKNFGSTIAMSMTDMEHFMNATAQLVDYDVACKTDADLANNTDYVGVYVFNIMAYKNLEVGEGKPYFDPAKGYFYMPKTIKLDAIEPSNKEKSTRTYNYAFTHDSLKIVGESVQNIFVGEEMSTDFQLYTGTGVCDASVNPITVKATYTDNLEQSFRDTDLLQPTLTKGEYNADIDKYLPVDMTATQKADYQAFKGQTTVDYLDVLHYMIGKGIKLTDGKYSFDKATANGQNDVYNELRLPKTIDSTRDNNYIVNTDEKPLRLRYFQKDSNGKFILATYKDVLMIGKQQGNSDYNTLDYVMTNNINMRSTVITPISAFSGSIDGKNFVLSNYIVKDGKGLFADNMTADASVKDIIIGNVILAGSGDMSAISTNATDKVTNVATEVRIVTDQDTPINYLAGGEQSFVTYHRQDNSNKSVTTSVTITYKDTTTQELNKIDVSKTKPITVAYIEALGTGWFGGGASARENWTAFMNKFVLAGTDLEVKFVETKDESGTTTTDYKATLDNFRNKWGWLNICPWITPSQDPDSILSPTKYNTASAPDPTPAP